MDAAEIHHATAVAGAEPVDGGIKALLLFVVAGHDVYDGGLKKLRREIPFFAKPGEYDTDLEDAGSNAYETHMDVKFNA